MDMDTFKKLNFVSFLPGDFMFFVRYEGVCKIFWELRSKIECNSKAFKKCFELGIYVPWRFFFIFVFLCDRKLKLFLFFWDVKRFLKHDGIQKLKLLLQEKWFKGATFKLGNKITLYFYIGVNTAFSCSGSNVLNTIFKSNIYLEDYF